MQITSAAVLKVREMGDKQQPEGYGLRIIVDVGGPDGFFYDLDFETAARPDDQLFVADGLTVYIDEASAKRFFWRYRRLRRVRRLLGLSL